MWRCNEVTRLVVIARAQCLLHCVCVCVGGTSAKMSRGEQWCVRVEGGKAASRLNRQLRFRSRSSRPWRLCRMKGGVLTPPFLSGGLWHENRWLLLWRFVATLYCLTCMFIGRQTSHFNLKYLHRMTQTKACFLPSVAWTLYLRSAAQAVLSQQRCVAGKHYSDHNWKFTVSVMKCSLKGSHCMSSLCSYAQVVTLIVVLYISVALGKVKNGTCKICRCFFFFF